MKPKLELYCVTNKLVPHHEDMPINFGCGSTGDFPSSYKRCDKGENILITDQDNNKLARGLASFSSSEIEKIKGRQSDEIERILGYSSKSEVVHKDDMVRL